MDRRRFSPSRNNHDSFYGLPTTEEQARFERHVGMFREHVRERSALTEALTASHVIVVMFPEHHMGDMFQAVRQGDTDGVSRASGSFARSMGILAGGESSSPQVAVQNQVQTVMAGNNTPATQQGPTTPVAGNGTDQGSSDGVDSTLSASGQ